MIKSRREKCLFRIGLSEYLYVKLCFVSFFAEKEHDNSCRFTTFLMVLTDGAVLNIILDDGLWYKKSVE